MAVDAGEDTARGNGHLAEELGEFFVIANGQLDVAGDDPLLLVVLGGVTGKLQDFSYEVLEHCSEVHGGTSSNASCIATLLQVTRNAANRELKTSLGASALTGSGLLSDFTTTNFTFTRHIYILLAVYIFGGRYPEE